MVTDGTYSETVFRVKSQIGIWMCIEVIVRKTVMVKLRTVSEKARQKRTRGCAGFFCSNGKESKGVDSCPPDSSDLSLERETESITIKLFNFIAWTLGFSKW